MKRKNLLIVFLLIVFFISLLYFFHKKNTIEEISIEYKGIDDVVFEYSINSKGFECNLDKEKYKNGDNLKLKCFDKNFKFINFEKNIEVKDLLKYRLSSSKDKKIFESYFLPFDRYYYNETPEGIDIVKIIKDENKNGKYEAYFYKNIFIDGDQVVVLKENSSSILSYESLNRNKYWVKVSDIEEKYLDEYAQEYLDLGFKKND